MFEKDFIYPIIPAGMNSENDPLSENYSHNEPKLSDGIYLEKVPLYSGREYAFFSGDLDGFVFATPHTIFDARNLLDYEVNTWGDPDDLNRTLLLEKNIWGVCGTEPCEDPTPMFYEVSGDDAPYNYDKLIVMRGDAFYLPGRACKISSIEISKEKIPCKDGVRDMWFSSIYADIASAGKVRIIFPGKDTAYMFQRLLEDTVVSQHNNIFVDYTSSGYYVPYVW